MKAFLICLMTSMLLYGSNGSDFVKAHYLKSYDYEQMGKYTEALKVLSALYKKYPKGYTLNLRFGWLFYLNGNYADAQKYYKKALLIKPVSLEAKLGLVRVFLATNSYKDAQSLAYEIMKVDFYNYYANLYAIKASIAQKKYAIAQEITLKMLALYPADVLFLEQLALIYEATNSSYLQQLYKDILILDPNNVLVHSKDL